MNCYNLLFLICCCEVGSWYMYGSFVPTSDARPFMMQREKVLLDLIPPPPNCVPPDC